MQSQEEQRDTSLALLTDNAALSTLDLFPYMLQECNDQDLYTVAATHSPSFYDTQFDALPKYPAPKPATSSRKSCYICPDPQCQRQFTQLTRLRVHQRY